MLDIQFLVFLAVCGALSGALYATTKMGGALFVVPTVFLFLPVFNLSASHLFLPVVATAVVSMIPVLLLDWIEKMKSQQVDSTYLVAFAPGAAMGGVIGAQCVSLLSFSTFPFLLWLLFVVVALNAYWLYRPIDASSKWRIFSQLQESKAKLPVSMVLSCVGVMLASTAKPFYCAMLLLGRIKKEQLEPTATGLALFATIAAMVGFAFPAKPFIYSDGGHLGSAMFAGGIHLLSCLTLALSQLIVFYLCRHRGNRLDRAVIHVAALLFLVIATVRLIMY